MATITGYTYKVKVKKNTLYYCDFLGRNELTWFDYFTTIELDHEEKSESAIKAMARKNLQVQIATAELGGANCYKMVHLENEHMEIVEVIIKTKQPTTTK